MEANNKLGESLDDFLNKWVGPKEMAKYLRRANYIMNMEYVKSNKDEFSASDKELEECFYYINQLAEKIDPYFDKEN